ncbi:MAG: DUF4249 domain-containing protein [Dysgonamonadaceae bacterium]|jgi:hypothetical protein|nr:DUF4249 domain-containing protein [Dysgonamonadaceae bacterium]
MNSKILSCLVVLSLLITGCISEFNANLPSDGNQILIVEGNIIGNSDAIFYLSKNFPLNSGAAPAESFDVEAKLTVIGSNGYKSPPAKSLKKGEYQIAIGELYDDVKYALQIEYDGNIYQSAFSNPIHTPGIDSVSWAQPEKFGDISFYISTYDNTKGAKFFMWDYTEIWEVEAIFPTTVFYDLTNNNYYVIDPPPYRYCWKNARSVSLLTASTESLVENKIINRQLYQISPKDERFSILYCVTVSQIAVSKSAYDYFQNKKTLNEEMGGLFAPQPSELRGNIICTTEPSKKAMGYVEVVKNTTQKRIFIERAQITRPPNYDGCNWMEYRDVLAYLVEKKISFSDYYRMGFRPVGDRNMEYYPKIIPFGWALESCTSCVINGAEKKRPDFWPNNHY